MAWFSSVLGKGMICGSEYRHLPIDEDHATDASSRKAFIPWWRTKWALFLATVLSLSIIVVLAFLPSYISRGFQVTNAPSPKYQHCGNSTTVARSRGCQFDLVTYAWLPASCIEQETLAEFRNWLEGSERAFGSWPFFADREGNERIADEQALSERVGVPTHSPQEEHLGHCIFLWRRLARMASTGPVLDIGLGHVHHCTEHLLDRLRGANPLDSERPHSVFEVGLGGCITD
ncbi:hypothetical protein M752DRAFT_49669 [Aspergillus phoenicis ATCC 13157]|uniref:Uncharacterized protein n=1 Tax=Aspergillus phoenicis ATCC 13157 TaxID=1353007 RepID=A0A370PBE3_ASPPH|nr:hypothetical protein M752DRAFT_49669 [Aspergillus phoenicis ATCC 13157]GLA27770.1 hypothetical protein AnigIFM63326_004988 [Aspergillus niger]